MISANSPNEIASVTNASIGRLGCNGRARRPGADPKYDISRSRALRWRRLANPDDVGDGRHPIAVEEEQHVVAGRRQLGIGWGHDLKSSRGCGERQAVDVLAGIERVR